MISRLDGLFAIYELLSAFLFSSMCIVIGSLMTTPPEKATEEDFDADVSDSV